MAFPLEQPNCKPLFQEAFERAFRNVLTVVLMGRCCGFLLGESRWKLLEKLPVDFLPARIPLLYVLGEDVASLDRPSHKVISPAQHPLNDILGNGVPFSREAFLIRTEPGYHHTQAEQDAAHTAGDSDIGLVCVGQ